LRTHSDASNPQIEASVIQFKASDTRTLGFEDAEQDSVLLELADLLSRSLTRPKVRVTHQRVVESTGTFKSIARTLAKLKPLNPESLRCPSIKASVKVKS
jgi:hypothetical protein